MEAFFYVDGNPAKGEWIDLEYIFSKEEILEALAEEGIIPRNGDGEPKYDGDLLVADYEGPLVKVFMGKDGALDFEGFFDAKKLCDEHDYPYEAAAAYVENNMRWDAQAFYEAYRGQYESAADYAYSLALESGELEHLSSYLKYNIDWESVAKDMQYDGFFWTADAPDGGVYVFSNV